MNRVQSTANNRADRPFQKTGFTLQEAFTALTRGNRETIEGQDSLVGGRTHDYEREQCLWQLQIRNLG